MLTLCQVAIPVSTNGDQWIAAEVLRDEFIHEQSLLDTSIPVEDEAEASLELSAKFLAFVAHKIDNASDECKAVYTQLLLSIFKHFIATYLLENDIHSVTSNYNTEVRKTVLSAYIKALASLRTNGVSNVPSGPQSALFAAARAGNASIFALFGGQGTNEVYFDELQSLYDIYKPFVAPFIAEVTRDVLVPVIAEHYHTSHFTFGLDALSWLSGASERPATSYLATVPISFPLIGLTQLVQFLVVCHIAGITPGQLRDKMAGATGHSQGIVSAVVIAASSTFESFTENAKKALKWLIFSGLRGQQAFPVVSLDPEMVQDAIDGGEGSPSPMLSVTGLSLKDLEPHIALTNSHLPDTSQLFVSLHNGPRAFVVTGPAKALFGLVTNLRKIRASSGLDQSKIPFSQRKQVFSVRFLVVGVPYHSEYLAGVAEKVLNEDLKGVELWKSGDLRIPVYNTDDGNIFTIEYISYLILIRFRLARTVRFGHEVLVRVDLHKADSLVDCDQVPRFCYACH